MLSADLSWSQIPTAATLTLEQASQIALERHPRIRAAELAARAGASIIAAARAPYFPTFSVNLTSVGAQDGAVAAGALTTSSLANRLAGGVVANQILTDFGRTSALTETARLRATGQERQVDDARAAVRLQVAEAYYDTLGARAVLTVANADLGARRARLRQVDALAKSEMKSTLDLGFAAVAVLEAEIAVARAEGAVQSTHARLAAAMGDTQVTPYELVDEPLPAALDADLDRLIDEATTRRPDLAVVRLNRDAATRFAIAERRLVLPTINFQALAGGVPTHDQRLHGGYSAAGVNITVPVSTGGLFEARRADATLRAQAVSEDVKDLTVAITRDVRIAWVEAQNAFRRLELTTRLVEQAAQTLRLAEIRYDLGLTSLVEINQAQLSHTSAQVNAARDRYEYLVRRAILDHAVGRFH
jgi:outer membrane protein